MNKLVASVVLLGLGCDGGKTAASTAPTTPQPPAFTEMRISANLPEELSAGLVSSATGTYATDISQAAGRLWLVRAKAGSTCDSGNVELIPLPMDSQPTAVNCEVDSETESVLRFQSIVDAGVKLAGNFTLGDATTAGNSKIEVVVTDNAHAFVPDVCLSASLAKLSVDQISAIVADSCDVIVAQGVTLTSILHKTYHKVENTGGIQGLAFSMSGNVYASAESYGLDYRVRIYPYFPLRSYVAVLAALNANQTVTSSTAATDTTVVAVTDEVVTAVTTTSTAGLSAEARAEVVRSAMLSNIELVNTNYANVLRMQLTP